MFPFSLLLSASKDLRQVTLLSQVVLLHSALFLDLGSNARAYTKHTSAFGAEMGGVWVLLVMA
jgi:hypothetical protein